jgi:hypothetical protein
MKKRRPLRRRRRLLLATLALAAVAAPLAAPGCAASFAPISQIEGLRILAVAADKPYAQPGDTVNFTMTYTDSYGRPPPTIVWIAGCYDPDGDEYYQCYAQFDGGITSSGLRFAEGQGLTTFSLTLPDDIISRLPKPANSPYYGLAYVFFAACDGTLSLSAPPDSTGAAGAFPIACLDDQGNRVGADSFVAGYTQVYAFADGATNHNPVVNGIDLAGSPLPAGTCVPNRKACGGDAGAPDESQDAGPVEERVDAGDAGDAGLIVEPSCCEVHTCDISEDTRLGPGGCGKQDPFKSCSEYAITVDVPQDVAEPDPNTKGPDGGLAHESVWVDYFADKGDFDNATLLVSDALNGIQTPDTYTVNYIAPPPDPDAGADAGGVTVHIWAVVHDSRGGETVVERELLAE